MSVSLRSEKLRSEGDKTETLKAVMKLWGCLTLWNTDCTANYIRHLLLQRVMCNAFVSDELYAAQKVEFCKVVGEALTCRPGRVTLVNSQTSISKHAFSAVFAEYRCLEMQKLATIERDFFIRKNCVTGEGWKKRVVYGCMRVLTIVTSVNRAVLFLQQEFILILLYFSFLSSIITTVPYI